jgi:hypothetical protein
MDELTAFGLFAVTAMLVCYALEDRSHWFILDFAGACASDRSMVSSGRVAFWRGRGHLVCGRRPQMVAQQGYKVVAAGSASDRLHFNGG